MARARDPRSNRSIARHLGVSAEAVRKAKASGRLPVAASPEEAARHYAAMGGPRRSAPADSTLAAERARHERIKAQLAQIELDRRLGKLLNADDVRFCAGELAELLRQGLEQLTPRLIQAIRDAPSPTEADRAARAVMTTFMGETAAACERRFRELTTDG
jgi:hypothetical protein